MSVTKEETLTKWNKIAKDTLQGRKIVEVRYMNDKEMEEMGWHSRPICFLLDNDVICILSSDDEGNDGGVLFYGSDGVLPTL
jgi:hypothetical protein